LLENNAFVGAKEFTKAAMSFREVIDRLDGNGQLAHVSRTVDAQLELMAVTRKMHLTENRGLLFEDVLNSPDRLATNILNDRQSLCWSLGFDQSSILSELEERELEPIDPILVKEAPVQEIVKVDDIDISRDLPQVVHSPKDVGPYITAGIAIACHPKTGIYNASWNRTHLVGGDHAQIRMMAPQHLGQYQLIAEKKGEPLPIAMVIGAPPSLMMAASSKIPLEANELAVAGGWQREPLRMAPAVSVPLMVPADAEYVIEGEILPGEREMEGPYGEFTDTYVEPALNHVLRVTAITRRSDAIYHAMLAGGAEDLTLLGVGLQVEVHQKVKEFGEIVDIGTPGHIFGCVVSIKKTSDEGARAVLKAALAAHSWMKIVVVVDHDVDVHDLRDVMWAIHTRCTPDTGLFHLPSLGSFPRSDVKIVHQGKIGFDATAPMDMREILTRREFPEMENMKLENYVD